MRKLWLLLTLLPALATAQQTNLEGLRIAEGLVPFTSAVQKFGVNRDIDAAAAEDIWQAGGIRAFLTAGETLNCVSDNAADTAAGTGARTLTLIGLDDSFDEFTETITLNGITPVTTAGTFRRTLRAFVATAGSSESNVGTLTCDPTTSGAGSRQLGIDPSQGQTQLAHYTVPDGYYAYLQSYTVSIGGTAGDKSVDVALQIRLEGGAWRVQGDFFFDTAGTSHAGDFAHSVPRQYPPRTDFRWRAEAETNNTQVSVQYTLVLVEI